MFFTTNELDQILMEDVPYFDLTAHLLDIAPNDLATISYSIREPAIISGVQLVNQVFNHLGITSTYRLSDGTQVKKDALIICGQGELSKIYHAWKVCQNILEYASAVATKTRTLVDLVHSENPNISILTTRKQFPLTKKIVIQAILDGGAYPHRLGISETILIFDKHIQMIGGLNVLIDRLPILKKEVIEKKIIVEHNELDSILALCEAGVDGIQVDKLSPDALYELSKIIKKQYPNILLLAAGGINMQNAQAYAKCSIDGIVTTSLYSAPPLDVCVQIDRA